MKRIILVIALLSLAVLGWSQNIQLGMSREKLVSAIHDYYGSKEKVSIKITEDSEYAFSYLNVTDGIWCSCQFKNGICKSIGYIASKGTDGSIKISRWTDGFGTPDDEKENAKGDETFYWYKANTIIGVCYASDKVTLLYALKE
jgi:hypothetical protein